MVAPFTPQTLLGGRYLLERAIAQGGMAEVWLATDTQLERQVAIKALKPHSQDDEVVVERFRREARALAVLNHPNIVPVYDVVDDRDRLYVVMRYVKGKSLREVLDGQRKRSGEGRGTISVEMTVHVGRSIALALKHAHDAGIVHRDVKPANILIESDGKVLLTDFGIAKTMDPDGESDLTNINIMMGTAKYLAPEQVQGKPLTGGADLYALGLVLYECLAGDVPFKGSNDQATAIMRLQRDPTPLNALAPHVPPDLVSVIHRLLRRSPMSRYASGDEVSFALATALAGSPDAPTPAMGGVDTKSHVDKSRARWPEPLQPPPPSVVDPHSRSSHSRPRRTDDRTPEGAPRVRGTLPRRQQSNTARGLLPVLALLAAAAVSGAVLWNALKGDTDPEIVEPVPSVAITAISTYDPDGDDGTENDAMVAALSDGFNNTAWTTVCYADPAFGDKAGVGVVATLSAATTGTLTTYVGSGSWQIDVFGVDGAIPPGIGGWGEPLDSKSGDAPGSVEFSVDRSSSRVLVLFREAGQHATCSDSNPFKGVLGELAFTAGG
jgi:serine/threonine protein kinase